MQRQNALNYIFPENLKKFLGFTNNLRQGRATVNTDINFIWPSHKPSRPSTGYTRNSHKKKKKRKIEKKSSVHLLQIYAGFCYFVLPVFSGKIMIFVFNPKQFHLLYFPRTRQYSSAAICYEFSDWWIRG